LFASSFSLELLATDNALGDLRGLSLKLGAMMMVSHDEMPKSCEVAMLLQDSVLLEVKG
jgi:hypothetical protein